MKDNLKRIYVAGPFSDHDTIQVFENMRKGIQLCAELLDYGLHAFCPWLDFLMIVARPDSMSYVHRSEMLDYSLSWLEVSDALLIDKGTWGSSWKLSRGTIAEWEHAESLSIPVYFSKQELIEDGIKKPDWVEPED